jgi:hypothetical protein
LGTAFRLFLVSDLWYPAARKIRVRVQEMNLVGKTISGKAGSGTTSRFRSEWKPFSGPIGMDFHDSCTIERSPGGARDRRAAYGALPLRLHHREVVFGESPAFPERKSLSEGSETLMRVSRTFSIPKRAPHSRLGPRSDLR